MHNLAGPWVLPAVFLSEFFDQVEGSKYACWKSNNTNARFMASALSLALDPTFGIHSLKTLDTAQPCHLLKPN